MCHHPLIVSATGGATMMVGLVLCCAVYLSVCCWFVFQSHGPEEEELHCMSFLPLASKFSYGSSSTILLVIPGRSCSITGYESSFGLMDTMCCPPGELG